MYLYSAIESVHTPKICRQFLYRKNGAVHKLINYNDMWQSRAINASVTLDAQSTAEPCDDVQ